MLTKNYTVHTTTTHSLHIIHTYNNNIFITNEDILSIEKSSIIPIQPKLNKYTIRLTTIQQTK